MKSVHIPRHHLSPLANDDKEKEEVKFPTLRLAHGPLQAGLKMMALGNKRDAIPLAPVEYPRTLPTAIHMEKKAFPALRWLSEARSATSARQGPCNVLLARSSIQKPGG